MLVEVVQDTALVLLNFYHQYKIFYLSHIFMETSYNMRVFALYPSSRNMSSLQEINYGGKSKGTTSGVGVHNQKVDSKFGSDGANAVLFLRTDT